MEGYDASTYGERFADVYDDWYADLTDVPACVERIEALVAAAGGGPVLELGVGSGRLAIPLVERGLEVHGIDASAAMAERLRAKPGGAEVRLTIGDMRELALPDPPRFAVVLVAFNTLFNLPDAASQQRCFERVASVLAPAGRLVVEAFVPGDDLSAGGTVVPRRITADEVVLSVSLVDPTEQVVSGQHVHLREDGIRLRPWHLRYAPPAELDAMAARAGLELEERLAGWRSEAFTPASSVHVSTYRRGNVRHVPDQPPAETR